MNVWIYKSKLSLSWELLGWAGNFQTHHVGICLLFWVIFLFVIISLPFFCLQLFYKLYRAYLLSNGKERNFSSFSRLLCFCNHFVPNLCTSPSHFCPVASVIEEPICLFSILTCRLISQSFHNLPSFRIRFRFVASVFEVISFCPVASLVLLFFSPFPTISLS